MSDVPILEHLAEVDLLHHDGGVSFFGPDLLRAAAPADDPRVFGEDGEQPLQGGDRDLAGERHLQDVAVVQPAGGFRDRAGVGAANRDVRHQQGVGRHAEREDLAGAGLRDRDPEPVDRSADGRVLGGVQGPASCRGDQRPGKTRDAAGDFR